MGQNLKPTLEDKAAVLEGLPDHPGLMAILSWNSSALLDAKFDRNELTLTIAPDDIRMAAATVRNAGYNFLEDLTAVDWLPSVPRFQVSYHILSHKFKERIRLRVLIDEPDPTVDSVTSVWPSANFYEREVFDLFGIRFAGHPNLRRIMMPDEWEGFPMRKDYPVEGYR
ncbi:MAG TPA: NADH-quinone oxidoreductase subunit C [Terracidiphilus sp.]|nr:NADH-quinone oxidoreductase subunit C [Terracidiphilus sp.]